MNTGGQDRFADRWSHHCSCLRQASEQL